MLIKTREKITGWVAYTVVGFLTIPFALWGIQSYFVSSSPVILSVGGEEITRLQVEEEIDRAKRLAQDSPEQTPSEQELTNRALSTLYSRLLVNNAVEEYGYKVSDAQLAEFLESSPDFQNQDGSFDTAKYNEFVASQQVSRAFYENNLRNMLTNQQFISQVGLTSFILPSEQKQYEQLRNEERKVQYVLIDNDHFKDPNAITDEEVLKQYEENPREYFTDFQFKLRYMELKLDDLIEQGRIAPASDEDVEQYYVENLDRYVTPETRTVRHILFDPEAHSKEELQERIQAVQDQLADGADFAVLAETYSDDFLTAKEGGALPPLSEFDVEDEAVGDAIFTLQEGEVSAPIDSSFGTQIFKLDAVSPEVQQELEEVRDEIVSAILNDRAREEYALLTDQIAGIADVAETTVFTDITEETAIASTVTEWLTPNDRESIFVHPKVRDVAFNQIFPGKSLNSGPVEISEGEHLILFAVDETITPEQRPFEEVEDDIRSQLALSKAQTEAKEQADEWLKELKEKKKSFSALTRLKWTDYKSLGYISRFPDEDVSARVSVTAFTTPYTAEQSKKKEKAYTLMLSEDGRLGIMQISAIRYSKDKDEESRPLDFSARETQALIESLEVLYNTVVNRENLQEMVDSDS